MDLSGKVAFITGAASGIGRTAAGLFAGEGAQVVIADLNEDAGERAAADIRAAGGRGLFVRTDITDPRSVQAAVARAVEKCGALHILYNNAGGSRPGDGPVTEVEDEAFWKAIQVDLYGTWLCCKFAIPRMINAGGGAIVNTASMVALIGFPGMDAYSAAKGGVAALTRSTAVEYAKHGIRINAVAPGLTLTERAQKWVAGGKMPESMRERHLLGLLQPENIARTALFLASEHSAGITGQVISVDSGMTIS